MADDVKVRLLICHMCKSIDELPDFDGPAEHDDLLQYRVSQHQFPSGKAHPLDLGVIEKKLWDSPDGKRAVTERLAFSGAPGTGLGMGESFYDVKSNFQTDALNCWKAHNRTQNCGDYMSDSKRLLPDTKADRKAEGMDLRNRPSTSLCQFCPYHSVAVQRMRKAKGAYDKKSWETS